MAKLKNLRLAEVRPIEEYTSMLSKARRGNDCPAFPICNSIGNGKKNCTAEGDLLLDMSRACRVSMVILLGNIAGVNIEPVDPKEIAGFSAEKSESNE